MKINKYKIETILREKIEHGSLSDQELAKIQIRL